MTKELEALRVAGDIGSGLDAEVDIYCGHELYDHLMQIGDELRFVLITSYTRVHRVITAPATGVHVTLSSGAECWVQVKPSAFPKCVRCWHHRADVGQNAMHPGLCGRCVENVVGSGETRRYA